MCGKGVREEESRTLNHCHNEGWRIEEESGFYFLGLLVSSWSNYGGLRAIWDWGMEVHHKAGEKCGGV